MIPEGCEDEGGVVGGWETTGDIRASVVMLFSTKKDSSSMVLSEDDVLLLSSFSTNLFISASLLFVHQRRDGALAIEPQPSSQRR